MNGAPLTRTPPRRSWGCGPPPPGWRRIQARRLTCLLLRAVQRRRVESLVLGALSSSPVHPCAFVLVLGTNIAVLLGCLRSRLGSVTFITVLTYYLLRGRARREAGRGGSIRPLRSFPWRSDLQCVVSRATTCLLTLRCLSLRQSCARRAPKFHCIISIFLAQIA